MRFSSVLRASFVGALFFSPAMAEEIEKVHEEALRVLREAMAQPIAPTPSHALQPSGTVTQQAMNRRPSIEESRGAEAEVRRMRAEREARLDTEARKRLLERNVQKAEERRQFEEFLKEREQTRARSSVSTLPPSGRTAPETIQIERPITLAAATTPVVAEPIRVDVAEPTGPARALPVTEAEIAPIVLAQATTSGGGGESVEDIHRKALEVLRQTQTPRTTTSRTPAATRSATTESPEELQQRAREVLRQQQTERQSVPAVSAPAASTARISSQVPSNLDQYSRDLERRAQELVSQGSRPAQPPAMQPAAPAVTAVPPQPASPAPAVLDNRTREIIERQDREISQQSPRPRPAASRGLTPEAEAQARQVLRQQQEAVATSPAPQLAAPPQATPPAPRTTPPASTVGAAPPVATPPPTPSRGDNYSRELEERARQVILDRERAQQTPAPQAPSIAQPSTPAPAVSATAATVSPAAPAASPANLSPAAQSKRDRLRELTELYRADKMTPAEYHQRRAQILAEP